MLINTHNIPNDVEKLKNFYPQLEYCFMISSGCKFCLLKFGEKQLNMMRSILEVGMQYPEKLKESTFTIQIFNKKAYDNTLVENFQSMMDSFDQDVISKLSLNFEYVEKPNTI